MRSSGILLPLFSLPSPYGIGTMGEEAREFIDFLHDAGQHFWQILPLSPTGYGDSPYQSYSGFATNPYFIDLPTLMQEGLLTQKECDSYDFGSDGAHVDYSRLYRSRFRLLRKAYARFLKKVPKDYEDFCIKNADWLSDYALFMALKDASGGKSYAEWEEPIRLRKEEAISSAIVTYEDDLEFYRFLQYLFFKQWEELKAYAHKRDVSFIGDVPFYVSLDSADVWAHPDQFDLDRNLMPVEVAGCPPDAFSSDGQLWGNPLYRWDRMKEDGYAFWTKRLAAMMKLYDIVRIDHFRGFDSYFAIPAGDKNARRGVWRQGPGMDLFTALRETLGELPIIIEDLGYLTPSVLSLAADCGFPGMRVLQFAFDGNPKNLYLPHNHIPHAVVYPGTHDNDTLRGWQCMSPREADRAAKYLHITEDEGFVYGMLRGVWSSVCDLSIVPAADLLELDGASRINTPSTNENNWTFRLLPGQLGGDLAQKVRGYMQLYGR